MHGKQKFGGRHHQSGFTLVELLVVIAIISILASMLLPVLAKARAAAYQTSCMNKQKNILLAQQFYADDNKDVFAYVSYDLTQGYYGYNSALIMFGYAGTLCDIRKGTESLFYCPTKTMMGDRWAYGYREGDYGVNSSLAWHWVGASLVPLYAKRNDVFRPSELFLTGDVNSTGPGDGKKLDGYNTQTRHTGSAVFSYVDGHVASRVGLMCYSAFYGYKKLPFYNAKE